MTSEDRLGGHLFGEQPAPGEQHGEEENSLHGVLTFGCLRAL